MKIGITDISRNKRGLIPVLEWMVPLQITLALLTSLAFFVGSLWLTGLKFLGLGLLMWIWSEFPTLKTDGGWKKGINLVSDALKDLRLIALFGVFMTFELHIANGFPWWYWGGYVNFPITPHIDILLHFFAGFIIYRLVHPVVETLSDKAGVVRSENIVLCSFSLVLFASGVHEFAEYVEPWVVETFFDKIQDTVAVVLGGWLSVKLRWTEKGEG